MAIAVHDAVVSRYEAAASGGTPSFGTTFSFTVTSGADVLLVWYGIDSTTDRNPTVASDLDTLVALGEVLGSATSQNLVLYGVMNPTAGTHTLTCDNTTATGGNGLHAFAVTLSGVDSYGTAVTNSGSGTSLSATVSAAGNDDWIIDGGLVNNKTAITRGADQSFLIEQNDGGATGSMLMGSTQLGSVSGDVMSWSWTGTDRGSLIAIPLVASAGGRGHLIGGKLVNRSLLTTGLVRRRSRSRVSVPLAFRRSTEGLYVPAEYLERKAA